LERQAGRRPEGRSDRQAYQGRGAEKVDFRPDRADRQIPNRGLLGRRAETHRRPFRARRPNRKIGSSREGYEASFLVLGGNALKDFKQVRNIRRRVERGFFINVN
jgi:hypothetical protein